MFQIIDIHSVPLQLQLLYLSTVIYHKSIMIFLFKKNLLVNAPLVKKAILFPVKQIITAAITKKVAILKSGMLLQTKNKQKKILLIF